MIARLVLALALAWGGAPAWAHRFHAGITDIGFNQQTGSVEVVHTYMTHDVEALLASLYQRQIDLSDPDHQASLRKYIEKRFAVLADDKRPLALRWIGLEVKGESVVIYQEIEKTGLARAARVRNAVLIDFLPGQINTLNINRRSFTFDRKTHEQAVN